MTFDQLAKAASATAADALKYATPLTEGFVRYDIATQRQRAMCVSQCAIESNYLKDVEESLYYKDAQRIANIYFRVFKGDAAKAAPYVRNHKGLSDLLYKGLHGRGLKQLTLLENYQAYSDETGIDFVSNPDLLLQPYNAAMSACWYFAKFRDCRALADKDDVAGVTRLVNGKAMLGLKEREAQYKIALGCTL